MRPTLPSNLANLAKAQNATNSERFDATWQHILAPLIGLGRAAGADFVEFFLERGRGLSCTVEDGILTDVGPQLSLGAGVRCFKGKNDCFVSTTDLSFAGLRRCLERALSILNLSVPGPNTFVPEIVFEPLRDYAAIGNKDAWLGKCASLELLDQKLCYISKTVRDRVPHPESIKTSYSRDWQEVLVASSDGISARDIRLTQNMGTSVLAVDGAHRASLAERLGNTSDPAFVESFDPAQLAEDLAESVSKMLYAEYVTAGHYPIIMANKFGGVIFHEACGHLLETTQIERKTTPFSDMKGLKIANNALTAWDEGLTPMAFGSIDMDDEGMPAQRTLLIENGTLKNFLADRAGSLKTGHPRTGSGRRQNFTYAAASRMRNTYIAPGPHSPDELFASVENGIYCKRMGGGSVGATGQFNFGVSEAYLIKNGKIDKPLKGATLIGDAREILEKISMCANDIELAAGFCGSVSGRIYTTVGQPHIKVDSIMVGGR